MIVLNTVSDVHALLMRAKDIGQTEQLDDRAALRRALAELPRLTADVQQNVRSMPAPREPKTITRWRPVQR